MNIKKASIFIVLTALVVAALFTLSDDALTPYVPFAEAKSAPGRLVQIIGKLDKKTPVKHEESGYSFTMFNDKDSDTITVVHTGIKPTNFEHSEQVVAVGKYVREKDIFEATKILVKCPSKYRKGNIQ
jgi:cytochrome c-type biogenesis protein CcmE